MATKEQVIAQRTIATERYILLTMPVLYLPLYRLDGASFTSADGHGHTCTVTSATWGMQGRNFNSATPDYIEIPATSTQFNFTSGDFSIIMAVKLDSLAAIVELFCRGAFQVDGWRFAINAAGGLFLTTNQTPAANQDTSSSNGDIVATNWHTVGATRAGAAVKLYKNGVDVTSATNTHVNPTTCARTAKIGVYDDKVSNPLDGIIGEVCIYNRALTPIEIQQNYIQTCWRYR